MTIPSMEEQRHIYQQEETVSVQLSDSDLDFLCDLLDANRTEEQSVFLKARFSKLQVVLGNGLADYYEGPEEDDSEFMNLV